MHESNVWIRVVHLVEYYRSIRFLPDGRALSLLTTEVPADTVRHMEPSFKSKGFSIGKWELHPNGLHDDEAFGRREGPKVLVEDLKDRTMEKYSFRMIFLLRQTAVSVLARNGSSQSADVPACSNSEGGGTSSSCWTTNLSICRLPKHVPSLRSTTSPSSLVLSALTVSKCKHALPVLPLRLTTRMRCV